MVFNQEISSQPSGVLAFWYLIFAEVGMLIGVIVGYVLVKFLKVNQSQINTLHIQLDQTIEILSIVKIMH